MSPRARIAIVVVGVACTVVGFVMASGSDDGDTRDAAVATTTTTAPAPATETDEDVAETTAREQNDDLGVAEPEIQPAPRTTPAPSIAEIEVVDAKPKGGVRRLSFDKGDTIRFRVTSDTADEIHVHGYDVAKDVAAGGSVTFSIPAKIDGRFEVELEGRGVQIAELEVGP